MPPNFIKPPIRILVQTLTHLVRGHRNPDKRMFMLNLICRYHWNRNFSPAEHRWTTYNDFFALRDQPCFFVLDYGQAPDDAEVRVLSYVWDGRTLEYAPFFNQDPLIQAKVNGIPFGQRPPRTEETRPKREVIRLKLARDIELEDEEFRYMREHPEDAQWVRDNVGVELWWKYNEEEMLRTGWGVVVVVVVVVWGFNRLLMRMLLLGCGDEMIVLLRGCFVRAGIMGGGGFP
ncbi:hypothetical protein BO94DRAFT_585783 [Aspergillus sclerotioniger CBS 115572]|uniref:Uncharacterized protein n=1 Tax=Aspergillus sclerotioniger CBS 115572 TaxID=1450535 RepID=A0A317WSP5_9EURO|nr:hypothetical protein BO94DRAFT_585783 [Aspergillus sclerotioniger CBS 115572]PWY87230.1 hypothetical protein BO94DRAFT_585783 [Aspergillus sclerotioniger CBS 115572]